MLVISPARSSERITLPAEGFGKIISSAGTESYGGACIELLEMLLGVDHWALFQYPSNTSINCLAMASRTKAAVVRANIDKFLGGYHSFDPSLAILRREPHEQPCVVNIDISDIKDRQYRQCFEATDTRERLSYFTTTSNDLNQLSIYRGPERRAFSQAEMTMFATLGSLIMATALLHENSLSDDIQPGRTNDPYNDAAAPRRRSRRAQRARVRGVRKSHCRLDHRRHGAGPQHPQDKRNHLPPAGLSKVRHLLAQRAGWHPAQPEARLDRAPRGATSA